jgi:hypothetical protein
VRTAYTEFVRRKFRCCVPSCSAYAEPHHVRTKGRQGQVDEGNVAPLCAHHHTGNAGVHFLGRRTFARTFKVCLPAEALVVLLAWRQEGQDGVYYDYDMEF